MQDFARPLEVVGFALLVVSIVQRMLRGRGLPVFMYTGFSKSEHWLRFLGFILLAVGMWIAGQFP